MHQLSAYFKALLRKNIPLIAILLVGFSFYAATLPREKHRVKMVVHYGPKGTDTSEYIYNPDGHISRVRNSHGNDIAYTYLPGIVLRTYYDKYKVQTYTDTMYLNKSGLVEKVTTNNPGIFTLLHEYNTDRSLAKSTQCVGDRRYIHTYKYLNENQISTSEIDSAGTPTYSATYQYYTDQSNTIGSENLGCDFVGRDSKNPIKYSKSQTIGMAPYDSKYIYHYDDKGRITIRSSYNLSSKKMTDSACYTYYSGVRIVEEK
jgi:hypothetical protein